MRPLVEAPRTRRDIAVLVKSKEGYRLAFYVLLLLIYVRITLTSSLWWVVADVWYAVDLLVSVQRYRIASHALIIVDADARRGGAR